jgi:hypothetical protein
MANRFFNQFGKTLEKEVVKLFGRVTFGAAGAPTLDATNSKGIKSITRTGAGAYDITLGVGSNLDVYPRFLSFHLVNINAAAAAAPLVRVTAESVATPTTGKISIQFATSPGVATDPGNGEEVRFEVTLKNSTAP